MKKRNSLTVVGIGASAGGLEPLQTIIAHLPKELPSTAIIIAQHLSPDYKSMLVELLGRKTEVPVMHIQQGMKLEGNAIYIAPPSSDVTIVSNTFQLQEPVDTGAHPSVDVLFSSLAKEFASNAYGIVLSGTGKDGTKGIQAIKRVGGITVVQDPITAKYDGMPTSAVNTGIIDHILSPEEIGSRFTKLAQIRVGSDEVKDFSESTNSTFLQIFDLLETRIGIDFSDYKTSTLSRRLQKRITEKKFDNEQEYLGYIRQHPEELDKLFESILIGVTSFFRDPQIFKAVEKILESIINGKKSGEVLRIWIPGCATGEEAYTYAIMIREILEKTNKVLPVQVFATDIDIKALHKARLGIYTFPTVSTVPKKILEKYFTKINASTYELNKDIRKMVLYSRHDVTSNPPFLRLDLISCRNLLIYFNTDLQKRVIPLFYYALNPNGYLVLGKSENIGQFHSLFSTESASHKIFTRKLADGKLMKFPHFRPTKMKKIIPIDQQFNRQDMTVSDMVKETLYNTFEYPYVVIDENLDIVEVHGEVSKFLKFKPGTVSLNFMKLVIPQLQIESRSVIGRAMNHLKTEKGSIRKLAGDEEYYVRLTAKPLMYAKTNNQYFIVIFEELSIDKKLMNIRIDTPLDRESPQMIELEQELDATKEHMNSLVEELETSNEELQALNEEMQASNEELQASNEELETSNEELQATNEELENAYSELREANKHIALQKDEIERSAENLAMLLSNTLVGFILINRDYQIVTYNETAFAIYKSLFGIRLQEGVSLIKVLPDTVFPAFHQNFKKSLEGKQVVSEEQIVTNTHDIRYFDFNYTPVKLERDEKEARLVAVSLIDITTKKNAELELKKSNEALEQEKQFIKTLTESIPSIVFTTDAAGKFIYCNKRFSEYTGMSFIRIKKQEWKLFIHPSDWEKTQTLWQKTLKTGSTFYIEHRIRNSKNEYRWHLTVATPIKNLGGITQVWIATSSDIHEQKLLDERKNEFISIASHELKTPVTSLKGYGHVLHKMLSNRNDKSADIVKKMDKQVDKLTELINDLLDVSKIESGKLQFKFEPFAFDELVDEVLEAVQLTTGRHRILREGSTKKKIYGDRERVGQVITNLLTNAVKYSPNADKVIIKIAAKDSVVQLSVRDYGIGIPKEKQDKIFSRFYRADRSDITTFSGMGLGLYISSEIIKRLHGDIWFESEEKKGSTFHFTLPLKKNGIKKNGLMK